MGNIFGQLPDNIRDVISSFGIDPEKVIACVRTDRNLDQESTDGYVLLTKSDLTIVYNSPGSKKINPEESVIEKIPKERMGHSSVYPQISGGLLILGEAEKAFPAVCFSNRYMKEFYKLVEFINKIIADEPITESDYYIKDQKNVCPKCNLPFPEEGRQVCPRCMDKRSLFKRVLGYFRPYALRFVLIILFILLHGVLSSLIPYLSGRILYDEILNPSSGTQGTGRFIGFLLQKESITALGILITVIFLVRFAQQIFGVLQGRMVAHIAPKAVLNIKADIYKSMQKLSVSFFNQRQTGSLLTRIQSDATEVMYFFIDGLPYLLVNIVMILTASILMFMMDPLLALFALAFIPVLFFISYKMIPRLWHLHGRRHRSVRRMNSAVSDNLTGARVVKAFGQESGEIKRFDNVNSGVRDAELDLVDYDNLFFGAYTATETISALIIWGIGSWFVLNEIGGMSYGVLIAFVGYVAMLNGPLDFMSFIFRWWTVSMNSAQRIFEVIDAVPEVRESPDPVKMNEIKGDIKIKDVSFSYVPNKKVLDKVTFNIKAGEYFGIVGKSGAGKTTLINLISRFYDPKEGEIYIDDVPIKEMSFKDIRSNIAIVSQDSYIFKGTVAENIAYARPGCSTEDIVRAAASAGAHDFIIKLSHGYDTLIGHGAKDLSGGEKQRISIARAILADPKILILDEATASVDTHTEQKIQRSLDNLVKNRTTISIAHRLSTLRSADDLIVLEDGRVAEQGKHDELRKAKGIYYRLLQLQTKALAIRGAEEYE